MYSTISQLHAAGFVEIVNNTCDDKYTVNNISQKRKNDFETYIPPKIENKIELKANVESMRKKTKKMCDMENGEIVSHSKKTVLKDNGFKSKIKSKNNEISTKINTVEPNTEISEGYIIGGKNRFYEKTKKIGRKKLRS